MGTEKICFFCKLIGTLKETSMGFTLRRDADDELPVDTLMIYWCTVCKTLSARLEKST